MKAYNEPNLLKEMNAYFTWGFDKLNTVGKLGLKYFTWDMFNVDPGPDTSPTPSFSIDKELYLFPRFFLEAEYEFLVYFGWVNNIIEYHDVLKENQ